MSVDAIVADFDAELSPAERDLIAQAREFGRLVVAPAAAQWDADRQFPAAALVAACAQGLAAIELPTAWGGKGLRFSAKLRACEELAQFDFGFAFSLVNHHNLTVRIAEAQPALAARLLPDMLGGQRIGCAAYTEPEHGSDLSRLETTARRVDGGWLLKGRKAWITNAAVADVVIVLAQTNPELGSAGFATFVVEAARDGFVREPQFALQGAHACGVGGFEMHDYFAPDEALLDPPGAGFRRALAGINGARAYVAAMCGGMLAAALALAVQATITRRAFEQRVFDFQGLRWSLVDAETDLAAIRLLAYRAARQIDAGQPAEEAAARAKKLAGDRTLHHLAACIQALGANGLRAEHPLMRHLVACKTACFTDGTTEMMNERLGKILERRYRS